MEFKPSRPLSIGMEMELQLLDGETLDLVDGILPLMELYSDNPYIKPEFIQNTVEVCSKVCNDLPDLESHISSLVSNLRAKCNDLGMTLCSAGSHPFGQRLALITPLPRYLKIEKSSGFLSHMQITFATHVHIGMPSGEMATTIMRYLKAYLPILIALSASSPFWRGYDTGYASYRHRILAATRSYGIPPSFDSWDAFSNFFTTAGHAGVFTSIHDIHWDIRPRPHLGTLEVRVMDAQPSVGDAVVLGGLVRALVSYIMRLHGESGPRHLPKPLPWWIEKENHFQASHLGLAAKYVEDERGASRRMTEVVEDVLEAVKGAADELGQTPYLEALRKTIQRRPGYMRQHEIYDKTGSLKQVVASLIEELEQETLVSRSVS